MEEMTRSWETIVHALGAPVVIWRSSTCDAGELELAYANPAALAAFRIGPADLTGACFHAVMPDPSVMPQVKAVHEAAREVLRSGAAQRVRSASVQFPHSSPLCFHFVFTRVSQSEVAMTGESPYKGFFDNSSDVFGVLAPAGPMLYVTPSAATIFGYAPEELGADIESMAIEEPGLTALLEARDFLLSGPHAVRMMEFRRQSKEGIWHDMEMIARDFIDDQDVGGVIFNSRDISQRKADERKILALNEDLEAFTYTVSHDLRLPLRLVTEILSRTLDDAGSSLSERARTDLARAGDLAGDMTALIRDLLAFSRTGNAPLDRSVVDLSALAAEVWEELVLSGSVARESLSIQDGLQVVGDPPLLRQVLANLLGNAVKFSQHVAQSRIQLTGASSATATHFNVRDNGVGFEPEQASQLFTVFRRLHQDPAIPGTGVGLAIVKRIVERHGGQVWAEGAPGEGATIHVALPGRNAWTGEG
jgi:PAS domain S-box-containing protein